MIVDYFTCSRPSESCSKVVCPPSLLLLSLTHTLPQPSTIAPPSDSTHVQATKSAADKSEDMSTSDQGSESGDKSSAASDNDNNSSDNEQGILRTSLKDIKNASIPQVRYPTHHGQY